MLPQWYTPASWERFLPKSWHATRTINPEWQKLVPDDQVDDYGFSADDYFIVVDVQPGRALVYKSDRYGAFFSWYGLQNTAPWPPLIHYMNRSIILHEVPKADGKKTLLHLRFRGKIAATGIKRKLLVAGGGFMDHITTAPMLAGLAERAEHSDKSS